MAKYSSAALALVIACAGATVADARIVKKSAVVPAGQQTLLWVHADPGEDCAAAVAPKIALIRSPQHGQIAMENTVQTISDATSPCNGQQVPATGVVFIPAAGYVGQDHFRYKWMKPDGTPGLDAVVEVTIQ